MKPDGFTNPPLTSCRDHAVLHHEESLARIWKLLVHQSVLIDPADCSCSAVLACVAFMLGSASTWTVTEKLPRIGSRPLHESRMVKKCSVFD